METFKSASYTTGVYGFAEEIYTFLTYLGAKVYNPAPYSFLALTTRTAKTVRRKAVHKHQTGEFEESKF
jgi:hypothetical protein